MVTLPGLGLKVWNLITDSYDHSQLADNWAKVDQHDHSNGKGFQIPTGGLADGAVSQTKLAGSGSGIQAVPLDGSVSMAKVGSDVVAQYEPAFATYKTVMLASGTTPGNATTGAANLALVKSGIVLSSSATSYQAAFYLDPTDFAANARTTKYRLRTWLVNSSASASNASYTVGLYAVASVAAGVATFGAPAGSAPGFSLPAGNSMSHQEILISPAPAAGFYGIVISTSVATENVVVNIGINLQVLQV